jgi:hypothetical protein
LVGLARDWLKLKNDVVRNEESLIPFNCHRIYEY